jgi:hypothetical protein
MSQVSGSNLERRIQSLLNERTPAQWAVIGIVLSLAAAAAVYRLVHYGQLDQTAALFIGLPTVLAVGLTLTPRAKSAAGMAVKGMTIGLILSGIFLGEGVICLLLAAPLFYAIALAIGLSVDAARRRERRIPEGKLYSVLLIPLLLMSLEGVAPLTTFPATGTVTATRSINATPDGVQDALARAPRFDRTSLPAFLGLGFPVPVEAEGSGLAVGDRRTIWFTDPHAARAALVLQVVEREPGHVRFHALNDQTAVARWLGWQDADVRWQAGAGNTTRVTWSLTYVRRLSPAWYFGPLEQYAATLSAQYLIQTAATPQ